MIHYIEYMLGQYFFWKTFLTSPILNTSKTFFIYKIIFYKVLSVHSLGIKMSVTKVLATKKMCSEYKMMLPDICMLKLILNEPVIGIKSVNFS